MSSSKRVLVIGGGGLVGSYLSDKYLKPSSTELNLLSYASIFIYLATHDIDTIINLAAKVGGLYDNKDNNLEYQLKNTEMTLNLIKAIKHFPIKRLITTLSSCVFADSEDKVLHSDNIHKGEPHQSNSGYSNAKRFADTITKELSKETDIEIVNLIPTNLYGNNDNYNIISGHVIPSLLHKFYQAIQNNSGFVEIKGDGKDLRQFMYAGDLARIIEHFISCKLKEKFNRLTVAVDATKEISIEQLVEKIVKITEYKGKVIYEYKNSGGQKSKRISSTELMKYYNQFSECVELDDGIEKVWEHLKTNYNNIRK
jgi:GDP-L-fucose synthase